MLMVAELTIDNQLLRYMAYSLSVGAYTAHGNNTGVT